MANAGRILVTGCILLFIASKIAHELTPTASTMSATRDDRMVFPETPPAPTLMIAAPTPAPPSRTSMIGDSCSIPKAGYVGTLSREDFDALATIGRDPVAFGKLYSACISLGRCTDFRRGERVTVMDTAAWSGMVQVRRSGDVQSWWTKSEACLQ